MAKKQSKGNGALGAFWSLMDSMKFAVSLLILLTVVSIVGVLLPQYPPSGFTGTLEMLYIQKFGKVLGGLFIFIGLDHLFTVWWYYLLLALLCFNLLVCSFNRLGGIVRLSRRVHFLREEKSYRDQSNHRSFSLRLDPEKAASGAAELLRAEGYRVFEAPGDNEGERLVYARRGSLSPFGPFLTHISMVLVIVGAAVSYLLSFEHFQWMARGDTIRVPDMSYLASPAYQLDLIRSRIGKAFGLGEVHSHLLHTDRSVRDSDWRDLPAELSLNTVFRVHLDRFEARFTPQGKPKAYLSTVTVTDEAESGGKPFSHVIKVNDPLIHRGVYFYQSSYAPGGGSAEWVDLTVSPSDSAAGSEVYSLRLRPGGESAPIGSSGDSIRVNRFVGNFQMNAEGRVDGGGGGEDRNPAVEVMVTRDGREVMRSWIFKNFPNFSHREDLPWTVIMGDYEKEFITGLSIRTHRSQNLIWFGFALMVLGVMLSFYFNHREFWVLARPVRDGEAKVLTAGLSYKWKQPFIGEFDRINSGMAALAAGGGAAGDNKGAGTEQNRRRGE